MSGLKLVDKPTEPKVQEKEYITFYNTMDVAKMLGCSPPVARAIMYRADFPLIRVGKALKVSKPAFEEWASKSRTHNN